MAFCPNCGTPNTDQAAKCVSCAFELAPSQKAKFKGTIMMTGVQAPQLKPGGNVQPPAAAPAPTPTPAQPAAPGRNMAFEKTMLGPMGAVPLSAPPAPAAAPSPAAPSAPREAPASADLGTAPTVEGPAPQFTPPSSAQPSQASAGPSLSLGGGSFGSTTGNFGSDDDAPAGLPKPNTNKVVALGCAVVLVVTGIIATIMFSMIKKSLFGSASDEEAVLAWRDSLGQALTAVSVACQVQCEGADKYFHQDVGASLLPQAKQLTPERLAKLIAPAEGQAQMLSDTDNTALATKLGLDAKLCVQVATSGASAVACSVPAADGSADLRIVHLAGIEGL